MKSIILYTAILSILACGKNQNNSEFSHMQTLRVGEFKGFVAINQLLTQRLVRENSDNSINIGHYFGSYSPKPRGLALLLGGVSGQGGSRKFINGTPNAMNMLLWQVAFARFSLDIGHICKLETDHLDTYNMYKEDFLGNILKICRWPSSEARSHEVFLKLWLDVMSYDAPESEFLAWQQYFIDEESPYATASATKTLTAMLNTMLLNPYFLLQH